MKDAMDVMQGTLDLIILRALSAEPMHAWGIGERVARMSDGVFRIGQGSIYPAVRRFEARGWVTSLWRQTRNNRIARYCELTPAGRSALSKESTRWRNYVTAVDQVIDAHL
jgi:transcriptional regulator